MGRPSKLTDAQWAKVEQRIKDGESVRSVAADIGIAESALRKRFSALKEIKTVANQLVAAERALESLPLSARISARTLADQLHSTIRHMSNAANKGAAISSRLADIAEKHVSFVETASYDNDVEQMIEGAKVVNALMRTANDSGGMAMELIKTNKESLQKLNAPQEDPKGKTLKDFYNI